MNINGRDYVGKMKKLAEGFKNYSNNRDILSYDQIEEFKKNKICREHNLPLGTEIFYFRECSSRETYAVSALGISLCISGKAVLWEWDYIDKVECDSDDGHFNIYFVNDTIEEIGGYDLIKWSLKSEAFAEILDKMAALVENKLVKMHSRFMELYNQCEWKNVIELGENSVDDSYYKDMRREICHWIAIGYFELANLEKDKNEANNYNEQALLYANKGLELEREDELLLLKAKICTTLDHLYDARKAYIELMISEKINCKKEVTDKYMEVTKSFLEKTNFTNDIELPRRKFLMFVKNTNAIAGCNDENDNIPYVFTLDSYPKDIVFPLGHPQPNILYMMHPMLNTHYYPCENIEETLFIDKVRDFCYLVQCLGATKIHFKVVKGQVNNRDKESHIDISASIGRKMMEVEGTVSNQSKEHYNSTKNTGKEWEYTFNPVNQPYCPTDSIWLKSDTSWQQMVKMRLQGNQLSFIERITSSETLNMSSSQQRDVAASFSSLLWKASGKVSSKTEEVVFKSEESEYEINVTFKPLDQYESFSNGESESVKSQEIQLTPEEERYKEEVLFCLEDDDMITSDERILLERKRVRFGISEVRAEEIEQMCCPALTEEEEEYIEIFKELCADGEITERKRRLLHRERESLGISEQRAEQLEQRILG